MLWWDRTARIKWELDELTKAGFTYETPLLTDSVVTLAVTAIVDGEHHRLEVDFPELYPYFRFEVRAPALSLAHHQHPFSKNLCLLPRATRHWDGATLASYLVEQLPKVIAAGQATTRSAPTDAEEQQAEPITTYYEHLCEPNSIILIDSSFALPREFRVGTITVLCDDPDNGVVRGTLARVKALDGQVLFEAPPHLQRKGQPLHGHIIQLTSPAVEDDPGKLRYRLKGEFFKGERDIKPTILAAVMPEEHEWRNPNGQGWIFIKTDKKGRSQYVRSGRAGANDLRNRAPELQGLSERKIAVFGLGCIGGVSAIELAKAGTGTLFVTDPDHVTPGTVLRWYLGLPAAGLRKTVAIKSFIEQHYPQTSVAAVTAALGRFSNDRMLAKDAVDGTALIYDATAEDGISYFLAELARHHNIPFVHVSSRQGGWGGAVIRLTKETGCWYCLQLAWDKGIIPPPPASNGAFIQPAGCDDPTFTGAGFDLTTIALCGVRTAVSTLAPDYPAQSWDVMIIRLRDDEGTQITPSFSTYTLAKDPSCKVCGSPETSSLT
jgi:molybdopterin/thiamine biosynthesis adenylyltransferase